MTTYEVWSVTTCNRYAKVFDTEAEAIDVLLRSRDAYPNDEFDIVVYDDDGTPSVLDL